MTNLSRPPPNMNLIGEVCNSLGMNTPTSFAGNLWATGWLRWTGPQVKGGREAILCVSRTSWNDSSRSLCLSSLEYLFAHQQPTYRYMCKWLLKIISLACSLIFQHNMQFLNFAYYSGTSDIINLITNIRKLKRLRKVRQQSMDWCISEQSKNIPIVTKVIKPKIVITHPLLIDPLGFQNQTH